MSSFCVDLLGFAFANRQVFTRITGKMSQIGKVFISLGLLWRVASGFWQVPECERQGKGEMSQTARLVFRGKPKLISKCEGGLYDDKY